MDDGRRSIGLTHVAMSMPAGSLTAEFRAEVLAFYGEVFGWEEMEALRQPDRLTLAVGDGDYLNVRERAQPAEYRGYEHLGVRMQTSRAVDAAWETISADGRCGELEALEGTPGGYRHFRFRHLLPLTVEVQYLPVPSA